MNRSRVQPVPARSTVALNKSIVKQSKLKQPLSSKAAEKPATVQEDEVFAKNLEIAIALLPTVTFKREVSVLVHESHLTVLNPQTRKPSEDGSRGSWIPQFPRQNATLIFSF